MNTARLQTDTGSGCRQMLARPWLWFGLHSRQTPARLQTDTGSRLQTDPGSRLQTDPGSRLQTDPSSRLQTDPSSRLQIDPSSRLQTDPRSRLQTDPGSGLQPHSGQTTDRPWLRTPATLRPDYRQTLALVPARLGTDPGSRRLQIYNIHNVSKLIL